MSPAADPGTIGAAGGPSTVAPLLDTLGSLEDPLPQLFSNRFVAASSTRP